MQYIGWLLTDFGWIIAISMILNELYYITSWNQPVLLKEKRMLLRNKSTYVINIISYMVTTWVS